MVVHYLGAMKSARTQYAELFWYDCAVTKVGRLGGPVRRVTRMAKRICTFTKLQNSKIDLLGLGNSFKRKKDVEHLFEKTGVYVHTMYSSNERKFHI